jgi:hypothetical protein
MVLWATYGAPCSTPTSVEIMHRFAPANCLSPSRETVWLRIKYFLFSLHIIIIIIIIIIIRGWGSLAIKALRY